MSPELDEKLCKEFPLMFKNRHASATETCMCWGFACDDGWYNILHALCTGIQWHINQSIQNNARATEYEQRRLSVISGDCAMFDEYTRGMPAEQIAQMKSNLLVNLPEKIEPVVPQVVVTQVKEKFGGLRFYYDGGDSVIEGMVRMAERMSAVTCEECGAPGIRRPGNWVRALCETHAAKEQV